MSTLALRRTAVPAAWRQPLRIGLTLWAVALAVQFAVARTVTAVLPYVRPPLGRGLLWPFAAFARGDSGHFVVIAQYGYFLRGPHDPRVAFFPGYPYAARYLADALTLGHAGTGARLVALALLAWAGTAAAAVLLWRWLADEAGSRAATIGVLAMLFGPMSLFLVASYSEGPFLALSLAAWIAGRRGRWVTAGLCAAAAGFLRINALFLAAGLAAMYVLDARRSGRRIVRTEALALGLPLAAVGSYIAYLRVRVGSWHAWSSAEHRGWHRTTMSPWSSLRASIERFDHYRHLAPVHYEMGLELAFAALYVVVVAVLAWRRMWPELVYVSLTAGALLTSGFYQAVPRSMIVAFPVFLLVGRWGVSRLRWTLVPVALAAAALLVLNIGLFTRGYLLG